LLQGLLVFISFVTRLRQNYTTAHSPDFSALKPGKSQKEKKFAEGGKKAESACYTPKANYTTAHSLDFSALKPDKSQRGKKFAEGAVFKNKL
jgi:hypothetical protein